MRQVAFAPNVSINPDRITQVLHELDLYIEQKLRQFREQNKPETAPGPASDEAPQDRREETP